MPKIWWWESKKAYYLQIDRKTQKRLGKTKAEAEVAYRKWLLEHGEALPTQERSKFSVAELGQEFLDHSKRSNDPRTYEFYCYFVVPFVERFGSVPAATFPPLSFTKWLDEHEGWKGSRRYAIIAVKRMFNWAVKDAGLLSDSPLNKVKKPPRKRRNRVLSPEERAYIFRTIRDEQFREYVFALLDTGCRSGEVMAVTASHVSSDGIRCRFKRLREKVAKLKAAEKDAQKRKQIPDLTGLTAYVMRHTFTTEALSLAGLPVAVVSALLGHKSTKMVDEAYNHTDQATSLLKEAARKAA